jgi:Protein of unknown function (DUF1214)
VSAGITELDAAWCNYAERIKAAGERIAGEGFTRDLRLRAEGYRYIKRLENLAHAIYIEFPSTQRPMLFRYGDDVTPFGATNTDNNYYRAMVDPVGIYRISGDVTGVKELLFSVQDGEFVFGKVAVLAEASLGDLKITTDGMLELYLGGPARERNWLPLPPGSEYINVREFVADWERDGLASLHIERVDGEAPLKNLEPADMIEALDKAAAWVEASVNVWSKYADGIRGATPVNALSPPRAAQGGAVNMLHGACQWQLGPGEALLVEFERPEVTYWSIQAYVIDWMQPLDFVNRVTSLNDGQLHVDADGKVRVVLAHEDPGVPNWLDTSGLTTGLISYRYVRATVAPAPATTLIELSMLREYLLAFMPTFSPADRREQVAARRRGIARRFRR